MQPASILRLLICLTVLTPMLAAADKYADQAKALLSDLDDKQAPILPELAKADKELRITVFRNVAAEADDCLAYYYVVAQCLPNGSKEDSEADKLAVEVQRRLAKDKGATIAVAIATTAAGGLKKDTIKESINTGITANSIEINNDCGNLVILNKHSKSLRCAELAMHPAERLRYWLKLLRK